MLLCSPCLVPHSTSGHAFVSPFRPLVRDCSLKRFIAACCRPHARPTDSGLAAIQFRAEKCIDHGQGRNGPWSLRGQISRKAATIPSLTNSTSNNQCCRALQARSRWSLSPRLTAIRGMTTDGAKEPFDSEYIRRKELRIRAHYSKTPFQEAKIAKTQRLSRAHDMQNGLDHIADTTYGPLPYDADENCRTSAELASNLRWRPEPATLDEGREVLRPRENSTLAKFTPTSGQPWSIPEPHLFESSSQRQLRRRITGMSFEETPSSTWYADRASPPLLLTFDAFGTLFYPKDPIHTQYSAVARDHGYEISESLVKDSFKSAFKMTSSEYPNYGKEQDMEPEGWWRLVIERTFSPLIPSFTTSDSLRSSLSVALYKRFATSAGYTLYPDVLPLLAQIGTSYQAALWPPRRTMLGVISNSDPRVRSILESFSININPALFPPRYAPATRFEAPNFGPANFAFATLSYEAGLSKPSNTIYEYAVACDAQSALDSVPRVGRLTRSSLELLSSVPRQFHRMHIGDSLEKDVLPALEAGWDAILLDRNSDRPITRRMLGEEGSKSIVTVINSLDVGIMRRLVSRKRIENMFESSRMEGEVVGYLGGEWEWQRKQRRRAAALKVQDIPLGLGFDQDADVDADGAKDGSGRGWSDLGKGLKSLKSQ